MADPANPKRVMSAYQVDKYFDAIKQVGAANSAGVFGGLVALNYFKDKPEFIIEHVKWITAVYIAGLFAFGLAYTGFFDFIDRHKPQVDPAAKEMFSANLAFTIARFATMASAFFWVVGSIMAAGLLWKL
jgi:hypothetical protein